MQNSNLFLKKPVPDIRRYVFYVDYGSKGLCGMKCGM